LPSDCAAEEGILEEAGVVKKDRIVVIRACDFECLRETLDALGARRGVPLTGPAMTHSKAAPLLWRHALKNAAARQLLASREKKHLVLCPSLCPSSAQE
jgi:hypothetical protein